MSKDRSFTASKNKETRKTILAQEITKGSGMSRDGQLATVLPINCDIFFVKKEYQTIFTTNNNCEKQ